MFWDSVSIILSSIIFLEILRLFQNLLEYFIIRHGRITIFGQNQNQIHFQFRLYVITGGPVRVLGLIRYNLLDFCCKFQEFVFWIFVNKLMIFARIMI